VGEGKTAVSQDVDMIIARINYRFGGPGLTQY
jgi:hypothetical protein